MHTRARPTREGKHNRVVEEKFKKKTGACVRTKTRQKKRERESFAARAHALALVANGLFKKREREIWKKRREKKERCA